MNRFDRFRFQPVAPLGKGGRRITGCTAHRNLSKAIAAEGTVLLKNDGTLPLSAGTKLCPFGPGFSDFLFGGGGSAWMETPDKISFSDGLRQYHADGRLQVFTPLLDFYNAHTQNLGDMCNPATYSLKEVVRLPILPEDLYQHAKEFGGIALFCLSRFSGESNLNDRDGHEGGFLLTATEQALFDRLCKDFAQVVVVLNCCGPVAAGQFRDNPKVSAVLYPMYSGGAAGEVLCELLLGKRYPSGHLQDTFAQTIEDYPCTANFEQYDDHVDYEEDIFVGYRYFETFSPEKVVYPFGFGLSYTHFDVVSSRATRSGNTIRLTATVTNTGTLPGKEVVQVYLSAPQGMLGKAAKVLVAFSKTPELTPGQSCNLSLSFDLRDFASFDDTGKVQQSAFVLEKGQYVVHMGTNVRDCSPVLAFQLEQNITVRQSQSYMAPTQLKRRLTATGHYEPLPTPVPHDQPAPTYTTTQSAESITLAQALEADKLDALLAGMTNAQLGDLLHGHPILNASDTSGIGATHMHRQPDPQIPVVPTADGGAGYRINYGLDMTTTFFACATTLAQTWNLKLVEKMGIACALELKENNAGIFLAPGMNLHRSPLCGRNFEYYSEDPLACGLTAAAYVRGVQSQRIAATIKHFCCNNKEVNRKCSDSRVSERALRELYLRGFEIAIRQSEPWALMTAYNLVNGQQSSTNWDAMEGILRRDWGYQGLIMTDWNAYSAIEDELAAGSNVKMPFPVTEDTAMFNFDQAVADGILTREMLLYHAKKVLEFIGHLE